MSQMLKNKCRTKNPSEVFVRDILQAQGWDVIKRGWPDFLCVRGNEVRFIEVKPQDNRVGMKPDQKRVAAILERFGIKVECIHAIIKD